jgi:hypothetical protein
VLLALAALPGGGLIVVVPARPRWGGGQRSAVKGAIGVTGDGCAGAAGEGYGRWVCEVLVWTRAPLLSCNELVAAAREIASAALTGRAR